MQPEDLVYRMLERERGREREREGLGERGLGEHGLTVERSGSPQVRRWRACTQEAHRRGYSLIRGSTLKSGNADGAGPHT